jgi:hypothetical protein
MPGFSKWSPPLTSPYHNSVRTSPLPHTCYMSCQFQSSWLDQSNEISGEEYRAWSSSLRSVLHSPATLSLKTTYIVRNMS